MEKYSDLDALLGDDPQAKQYFSDLPDYVQSQIKSRAAAVNSYKSLRDYAENLLRGDG